MIFTHNYLMQEFPSERILNVNISNDICTMHMCNYAFQIIYIMTEYSFLMDKCVVSDIIR